MKIMSYTATAVLVVLCFYLLIVGESLLLPLVIAIAIWYLINTLASAFNRLHIGGVTPPMPLCLVASLCTFFAFFWWLANFLGNSFGDVMEVVPVYQANLAIRLQTIPFFDATAFQERSVSQLLADWIDLPRYAASLAGSAAGILANSGLILIYISFLFFEQNKLSNKISALVADPRKEKEVRRIMTRIRDDIQKYISIKVFTSSLTGLLSYSFLLIVDVDFAGVWGLLIFLLNFIPTVGSIVATIFPAMIALAQSDGYVLFLQVLIGIGLLQVCIGNVLEPRLMGSSFNLSPIIILLNLALWGYIWGIPGMFLCVPFLIIITIILSHFPQTRAIAIMLSSDGDLQVPLETAMEPFNLKPDGSKLLGNGEGGKESPPGP